jgi:hypothetical protein
MNAGVSAAPSEMMNKNTNQRGALGHNPIAKTQPHSASAATPSHLNLKKTQQLQPQMNAGVSATPNEMMNKNENQRGAQVQNPIAKTQTHSAAAATPATTTVRTTETHFGASNGIGIGRKPPPGYSQGLNHQSQRSSSNSASAKAAVQQNQVVNSRNMSIGHQQAAAMAAVLQHQAITNAADNHLQWRMYANGSDAQKAVVSGDVDRSQAQDNARKEELFRRDKVLQQYNSEIARRMSNSSNGELDSSRREKNSNQESSLGQTLSHGWQNRGNTDPTNERKRSLSETEYGARHPTIRRGTVPNSDVQQRSRLSSTHPARESTNSPLSRSNHSPGAKVSNSSSQKQSMSDVVDMALDETIAKDSAQNSKTSSGRRVETPMSYLVRQLLGQVEVYGNEPAVVLAPHLVREASQKIRTVISKAIEKVADKTRNESHFQVQEAVARSVALEEEHAAQNMKAAANLAVQEFFNRAQQQKSIDDLKNFAEDQVRIVHSRDSTIQKLRKQLEKCQADLNVQRETETLELRQHNRTPAEKHSNTTIRNLISQLDEGMTKLQYQGKEIEALKALIRKDTASLQGKNEMKEFIMKAFDLPEFRGTHATGNLPNNDKNEQIESLQKEVDVLSSTLKLERQRGENSLRAYMRAAVHALKMQGEMLEE